MNNKTTHLLAAILAIGMVTSASGQSANPQPQVQPAQATTTTAAPPAPQAAPCAGAAFRKLDFWVGEWDVTTPDGAPAGKSRVERVLDGCVILEHWSGAGGGTGMSTNNFDPAAGSWTQRWLDNGGTVAQMTGEFQGNNLVYRREFKRGEVTVLSRMTFFDLGQDGVRQLVERSVDGGKTWKTGFDGRYHRHAAAAAQ